MVEFLVLGSLEAWRGGHVLPLGGARQRAVLGLLLLHPNQVVPTELLVAVLWGDRQPASASQVLQDHVTALRKALGGGRAEGSPLVLVTREPGYLLVLDPGQVDAHRFTRLAAQGRRALAEGDPGGAARTLREALALWRGPVLGDLVEAGFSWPDLADLEEARLVATEDRLDADLALGRHRELVAEADAWGDGHTPAVARAFRARALLAAGRRDEAAELTGVLLEQLRPGLLEVTLGADFGVTLVELGHAAEVLDGKSLAPSRWLDALRALLAGEEARAADLYAEIGSRPDEALTRLRAGRRLLDAGEPGEARAQLEVAVAFWREVRAAAYLAEAEPLLLAARDRRPGR